MSLLTIAGSPVFPPKTPSYLSPLQLRSIDHSMALHAQTTPAHLHLGPALPTGVGPREPRPGTSDRGSAAFCRSTSPQNRRSRALGPAPPGLPRLALPSAYGELLKLGYELAEGTIAIDFFTVPTATFTTLCVFLVLSPDRRRAIRFNVSASPTADWISLQLIRCLRSSPRRPRRRKRRPPKHDTTQERVSGEYHHCTTVSLQLNPHNGVCIALGILRPSHAP